MKSIKTIITNLVLYGLLSSCSSTLPVYKVSTFEAEMLVSEKYDNNANIGYTVSKDESYLYVTLNTFDTASQIKILKNGVALYFDIEGGKKMHTYIQYPVPKESKQERPDFESLNKNKAIFLKKMIYQLDNEIQVKKHGDIVSINKQLNTQNIEANLKAVKDELIYQMKFPLNFIETNENQLSSMGIFINGISRPSSTNGSYGGGRPSGVGGGRPSGAGGGRPSGGGRPGGSGSGRPSSSQMKSFEGLDTDIDIWFKLEL
jgi:uncharacterized membrane protein YgcG